MEPFAAHQTEHAVDAEELVANGIFGAAVQMEDASAVVTRGSVEEPLGSARRFELGQVTREPRGRPDTADQEPGGERI